MPTKCQDSDPPLGGVLYAGGYYSEGGYYMPVYTVSTKRSDVASQERFPASHVLAKLFSLLLTMQKPALLVENAELSAMD
jgi:hypothetical protein